MFIGSQHVESPYVEIGAAATAYYFAWFLVVVPVIGIIVNTLIDIARKLIRSCFTKNTYTTTTKRCIIYKLVPRKNEFNSFYRFNNYK